MEKAGWKSTFKVGGRMWMLVGAAGESIVKAGGSRWRQEEAGGGRWRKQS